MFGGDNLPSSADGVNYVCEHCSTPQYLGRQEVHAPGCPKLAPTSTEEATSRGRPLSSACGFEVCAREGCMQHCPESRRDAADARAFERDLAGVRTDGLQSLVGKMVRWKWVQPPDGEAWGNTHEGMVQAYDAGMVLIRPGSNYARPRWWPVTAFKWLEAEPAIEPQRRTPERPINWRNA